MNCGQLDRLQPGSRFDVAFRLKQNRWNGTVAPQLVVDHLDGGPVGYDCTELASRQHRDQTAEPNTETGHRLREWDLQAVRIGHAPGHKVLALADLRSSFPDPDRREPGRTIELHLTGHMDRYVWSFNGVKFSDATPLEFTHGERLRIVLINDTMMEHPIHLHGMWSDVEDEDGARVVRALQHLRRRRRPGRGTVGSSAPVQI